MSEIVKTCRFGHHWYAGPDCPMCAWLGEENLERAYGDRKHEGDIQDDE